MAGDFEDELRRSLSARASDVSPDPALFARVQSRIRRGRTFRLALAGVAGALAVGGAALAAPGLIDRRVEFEPGPVAGQPASETATPAFASEPSDSGVVLPEFVYGNGEELHLRTAAGDELLTTTYSDIKDVAVRPSLSDEVDLVFRVSHPASALSSCGALERWSSADGAAATLVQGDPRGAPAPGCPSDPTFSPSGDHLAWLEQDAAEDTWALKTVDWTEDGAGEGDASFGLPWPGDQPVDLQEWVWTEQTATQARGYLVLRTQREGAWMLLQIPIERQADGALAVSLQPVPLLSDDGATPVAFATGGAATSYTMEVLFSEDGPSQGRVIWRNGDEVEGGRFALPAQMFSAADFDVADVWMTASPAGLIFGNAATRRAWWTDFPSRMDSTGATVPAEPELLPQPLVHADLRLEAGEDEAPLGPGETGTEPAVATTQVDVVFGMTGADACVADQPVARQVEGQGVARAALTELLEGPTSRESNEGIVSPFSANTADALNDITIVDGQARVDFRDFRADVGDDPCTKSAIEQALNKTLFQFPTIKSTLYSFDGDREAWNTWLGMHSESPPAAVMETRKAIYDAARNQDWQALRRLSKGTACTMSDQPEPCVPVWKELQASGADPLGTMIEILNMGVAKNPDAPIWAWPSEWFEQEGYQGPRIGIDEDGTWLYFVQEGG